MIPSQVFNDIYNRIRGKKPSKDLEVVLVGVCGYYSAGKTIFSENFSEFLKTKGIEPHVLESDMYFKLSKPERQALFARLKERGEYAERFHEGYNLEEALITEHLEMMQKREDINEEGLYQRKTGEKDRILNIHFNEKRSWVIYDGVWVANPLISNIMDFILFLEANKDERMQRANHRAQHSGNSYNQSEERFNKLDVFTKGYISKFNPCFNLRIENTDYDAPIILT